MFGGRLLAVALAVVIVSALPAARAADTIRGDSPGPTIVSDPDGGRTWYHEVPSEPGERVHIGILFQFGFSFLASCCKGCGCWLVAVGTCSCTSASFPAAEDWWLTRSKRCPIARTWRPTPLPQPAAVGTLLMLHRCGRNAEDFWPPSSVCPQCIGMPEGVSISRQGLARGYALLAINSLNRTLGSGGRCFRYDALGMNACPSQLACCLPLS
jgi:hypothetical protein